MSRIVSAGTALPHYRHYQHDILQFMQKVYNASPDDRKKIATLYAHSGINTRYSVIPDYSAPVNARLFYPATSNLEPFPALEKRMELYHLHATALGVQAIRDCLAGRFDEASVTHLITVSCTGMSAPGLDIGILREMQLPAELHRTSVNFMGCYAALHALKMADYICRSDERAVVLIVCVELCTLHFQKEHEMDSIVAASLFSDGAAAVLVAGDSYPGEGIAIRNFYAEVALEGQADMAWQLSGRGFLMTLSAYIPRLIRQGIEPLLGKSLAALSLGKEDIHYWAIHPGGRKILEAVGQELQLGEEDLAYSYHVLREYGNMSSAAILFVLKLIMQDIRCGSGEKIFMAAFGPGLTMETAILEA